MAKQHYSGMLAELKVAEHYVENEYDIYWPAMAQSPIDFIACKNSEVLRIQVKKAYWMTRPSGASYLQATTRKGCGDNKQYDHYTKEHCDIVAVVADEGIWAIPVEILGTNKNVIVEKGQQTRKPRAGRTDWSVYKIR